jgi:hypothetical protein
LRREEKSREEKRRVEKRREEKRREEKRREEKRREEENAAPVQGSASISNDCDDARLSITKLFGSYVKERD